MLKIDNNLLVEVGLGGLPDAEKNSFLKHIYDTLEMRVGIRLADQMTNEQLDEFERYFEAKDDAGAFKWLETNFPNYKEIVQEEFDKLKAEVKQTAPQILSASGAGAPSTQEAPSTPVAQPGVVPPTPSPTPSLAPTPSPDPVAVPVPDPFSASVQDVQNAVFEAPQPVAQAQPGMAPAPEPQFQPPNPPQAPSPLPPTPPAPMPPQPPAPQIPQSPVPQQPQQASPFPSQQPPAGPGQVPPSY